MRKPTTKNFQLRDVIKVEHNELYRISLKIRATIIRTESETIPQEEYMFFDEYGNEMQKEPVGKYILINIHVIWHKNRWINPEVVIEENKEDEPKPELRIELLVSWEGPCETYTSKRALVHKSPHEFI